MDQIKENKAEILETIRKYGKMPINPERAAFLANCWAAYNALCMICGKDEAEVVFHDVLTYEEYEEKPLTMEQVMSWVSSMENADGTHGGKWTLEQTEQVRKQRSIDCDPLMFYAAMNMMYSDYCKAVEKVNAGSADLYAYMAKAFLDDKDAMPHKLARYYHNIAEK